MKGLFLYGAKCDPSIWNHVREGLSGFDIDYVSYPHEVLREAKDISDIAEWVTENYGNRNYGFVAGHSMGGQIALKLVSAFSIQPSEIILIESNPAPSGVFYRNLMTKEHTEQFGERVRQMFQSESPYYNRELLLSLQDDYNLTECIRKYQGKIHAIYGDRGQPEYANRISDLFLPPDIAVRMKILFIKDACHLPMLENPDDLIKVIRNILDGRL